MDKWQAQDAFWGSFGLPAYDSNTVPFDATMPYITYEAVSSRLGAVSMITASIWYRSKSWRDISTKAGEIETLIYNMAPSVAINNGRYKVRLPESMSFAQRMSDPDPDVRRIVLNVELEFLTPC